jgi:hypothetical protein
VTIDGRLSMADMMDEGSPAAQNIEYVVTRKKFETERRGRPTGLVAVRVIDYMACVANGGLRETD